jgi:hypothetical protein
MLRIHGSARSRALRTLWMVGELGLEYEHNDLLPRSPGTRTPELLANGDLETNRRRKLYCLSPKLVLTDAQEIDMIRREVDDEPRAGKFPYPLIMLAALKRVFPCSPGPN